MSLAKPRSLSIRYIEVVNGKRAFGLIFELVKMHLMYPNVSATLSSALERQCHGVPGSQTWRWFQWLTVSEISSFESTRVQYESIFCTARTLLEYQHHSRNRFLRRIWQACFNISPCVSHPAAYSKSVWKGLRLRHHVSDKTNRNTHTTQYIYIYEQISL